MFNCCVACVVLDWFCHCGWFCGVCGRFMDLTWRAFGCCVIVSGSGRLLWLTISFFRLVCVGQCACFVCWSVILLFWVAC